MDEIEIFSQLGRVEQSPALTELFDGDAERARTVAEHLTWLRSIRHELPSPARHYKIGIYIRYFNQTMIPIPKSLACRSRFPRGQAA